MTAIDIKLGDKTFPIPLLAPRQQRIVGPAAMRLLPMMDRLRDKDTAIFNDPACYDDLIDVVYPAVQRGTPDITRDQFLDTPMTMIDLISAFPTVLRQAGFFSEGKAEGKPQAPAISPTGTQS